MEPTTERLPFIDLRRPVESAYRFEAHEPTLIVPLDGSDLAGAALPVARQLAQATGAGVVFVAEQPIVDQALAASAG